jgi:hypothetical protein
MNEAEANSPAPACEVRRATLEDLPGLKVLWASARLPVSELDKRFTEFQLAIDDHGQIAGALGLQINKTQGLVHSEAFAEPELAVKIRPLLWQRIVTVAKNNGLARLWTLPIARFYREQGMLDADEATRSRLPENFGHPKADWVTLKLKEENQSAISIEKEFEIFAQAQRDETEQMMQRAQSMRMIAYALLLVVIAALGAVAYLAWSARRKRSG